MDHRCSVTICVNAYSNLQGQLIFISWVPAHSLWEIRSSQSLSPCGFEHSCEWILPLSLTSIKRGSRICVLILRSLWLLTSLGHSAGVSLANTSDLTLEKLPTPTGMRVPPLRDQGCLILSTTHSLAQLWGVGRPYQEILPRLAMIKIKTWCILWWVILHSSWWGD